MIAKIGFQCLWQLNELERLTTINIFDYFDYSRFTLEWSKDMIKLIGQKNFDREYPFGKEKIEFIQLDNTIHVIKMSNFPRQCGKSSLIMEFCRKCPDSLSLVPSVALSARRKEINKVNSYCCSCPQDLRNNNNIRGKRYQFICFDNFSFVQNKNIIEYKDYFKQIKHPDKPLTILIMD